jgi:uncharacterized protein
MPISRRPRRRLAFCEREVVLNRRTAPEHYLGVRRITRQRRWAGLDGAGALVDAVVEMRRFDQDALLDRLATRGALTAPLMERLAVEIARLHDACPPDRRPGSGRVAEVLAVNEAALAETHVFAQDEVAVFNAAFCAAAAAHRPLLDARGLRPDGCGSRMAICTCATSSSRTGGRSSSTASSSTTRSPRSTCSTIWPFC